MPGAPGGRGPAGALPRAARTHGGARARLGGPPEEAGRSCEGGHGPRPPPGPAGRAPERFLLLGHRRRVYRVQSEGVWPPPAHWRGGGSGAGAARPHSDIPKTSRDHPHPPRVLETASQPREGVSAPRLHRAGCGARPRGGRLWAPRPPPGASGRSPPPDLPEHSRLFVCLADQKQTRWAQWPLHTPSLGSERGHGPAWPFRRGSPCEAVDAPFSDVI